MFQNEGHQSFVQADLTGDSASVISFPNGALSEKLRVKLDSNLEINNNI